MLFDHGADAVTSFILGIQVLELIQLTNANFKVLTMFGMLALTYFCAMWAQYSTGVFKLGVVNPVDEGLPGYAIFALSCIFIPYQFWNTQHIFGTYNMELMTVLWVLMIPTAYFLSYRNYSEATRPLADINRVLLLPLSYAVVFLALFFSAKCPFEEAQWPLYYALMFSWARNMIQIQLCEVVKQEYKPFNIGSLSFIIASLAYLFLDVDPNHYFWGLAIFSGLVFLEFVVSVIRQLAQILEIEVFSIAKINKE
jgi:hypothetical protein